MLAKYPEGSRTVILQLYKEHEQASVGDDRLRLGITNQVLHDIPSVLKTTAGCW
jgi:hypothetical protein